MGANRFKWYDDEVKRPIGPRAGFKDYVRLRKAQGYNWVSMIAAYPNWKTDDSSYILVVADSAKTTLRSAWEEFGTSSAKNMDNEGGRPFLFPGKMPGYENYFPIWSGLTRNISNTSTGRLPISMLTASFLLWKLPGGRQSPLVQVLSVA
jgi:hypothetical protein